MDSSDEWEASDKLPALQNDDGGLILPPNARKVSSEDAIGASKSRLGLDKLAREKRSRLLEQSSSSTPVSEQQLLSASSSAVSSFPNARRNIVKKRPRAFRHHGDQNGLADRDSLARLRNSHSRASRVSSIPNADAARSWKGYSGSESSRVGYPHSQKHSKGSALATGAESTQNRSQASDNRARQSSTIELRDYEAEEARAEREWYLGDDASTSAPEAAFYGHDELEIVPKKRVSLSAKAASGHEDTMRWENSQMYAGLRGKHLQNHSQAGIHDAPDDDDIAPRVALLVNDVSPAFFNDAEESLIVSSTSRAVVGSDVVMPVKDATSDMAVIARRGSAMVMEYREKRGRSVNRVRYWELGSTAGAKAKEDADAASEKQKVEQAVAGSVDSESWRKQAGFGDTLESKNNPSDNHSVGANGTSSSLGEVRRSLPVYSVRDELLGVIRENQVIVVVGETGSGKTTQLTQYLHEEGYTRYGVVGCTQPRRVAAVSVAQRVADEYGGRGVGAEVGYAIRFEDCTSSATCIKYMTDGILLRETLSDPDLDNYSVIIMDEAHERSLNTDVLFGALRNIIRRRRDLKVIITSATLNADRFAAFFGQAPVFHIPGRTFPVDIYFSKTPVEDYVDGAVWQVMQIHLQAPLPGDILVFMTGQEDIETICEALADKMSKLEGPSTILILPIYSQLASDMQAKIFDPAPEGVRKVVVATNIAETSLTIDGIRYVVDSGYCKLKTYNPRLGLDALLLCPASQAAVDQRAGRAGRTGPGKCYRLFTAAAYASEMLQTNVPEIQRTNLSHVVLLLKSLDVVNVLDFPFLDPPPAELVLQSMLGLWYLGALDGDGNLTDIGRRMSGFPLDPALSALLLAGEEHGCIEESVTIVAMLSVPNVFMRPQGREEESDAAREKFFIPESDHLTLLHTYQRWMANGCRADWSAKHFINNKGMRKAREVREQLIDILKSGAVRVTSSDDWDVTRRAVVDAYYYQAARRKGMSDYINIRSGVVCGLHPTSAIFGTGLTPDYVVYHELIYTKKEYMSCVTAAEPQWLANAHRGPLLYKVRVAKQLSNSIF